MAEKVSGADRQVEIRLEEDGGTHVVRLTGELDVAGCDRVEEALRDAEATEASRILVDIDGLRFVDSHGLRILLRAHRRDVVTGAGRLRITRGRGHVAELLRLTAIDQTLPFADGVA